MQLPKVGDVVERLNAFKDDRRFFLVLERPHERYYKLYNIITGEKSGWNLGWSEEAERDWGYQWRIV